MRKKEERKNASLRRRQQSRQPYDLVLIVCEGAKTEPDYFKALRNELRLSSTNICICGKECGSAPNSVVEHALQAFQQKPDYDRVFCVFDKDRHETYKIALDKIRTIKFRGRTLIEAITSVPCFEFWLLLHFEDSAHYYVAAGKNSACDQVMRDLRKHLPNYEKGDSDIFNQTYPLVDQALKRAELLKKRQKEIEIDNPSTDVHNLVAYLRNLKK